MTRPVAFCLLSRDRVFARHLTAQTGRFTNAEVAVADSDHDAWHLLRTHREAIFLVDVGTGGLGPEVTEATLKRPLALACYDGGHAGAIETLTSRGGKVGVLGKASSTLDLAVAALLRLRAPEDFNATAAPRPVLDHPNLGQSRLIRSSRERDDCIKGVVDTLIDRPSFVDFQALVATVTWELIMNAIFSAPIDQRSGHPRYADRPRTDQIDLEGREEVTLAYGGDERLFGVEVSDRFGRLSRPSVLASLLRVGAGTALDQFRGGDAGAGVGYFMIIESVSLLCVRVRPRRDTSVAAIFVRTKRRKEFVTDPPCILFDIQEETTAAPSTP